MCVCVCVCVEGGGTHIEVRGSVLIRVRFLCDREMDRLCLCDAPGDGEDR